jgi:hypothetical protein
MKRIAHACLVLLIILGPATTLRALCRAVLWRRKSFGTQSAPGSRFVGRVLTVVTPPRQQGRDVLKYLTKVCRAHPRLSHQTA